MSEEKPRLARLAAIMTQLQAQSVTSARALAEKHGVSIRTIYRDMRTLEKSGIPVVVEEGKGYALVAGYNLPPVMFTEQEALALITAEQLIRVNSDQSLVSHYERAVTKIKAILKASEQSKIELLGDRIQIREAETAETRSDELMRLQTAITNFQLVQMNYCAENGEETVRTIEPFALYTTRQNWVLIAFCRMRDAFRAFRLDRIKKLNITGDKFEPHPGSLEDYLEACRKGLKYP